MVLTFHPPQFTSREISRLFGPCTGNTEDMDTFAITLTPGDTRPKKDGLLDYVIYAAVDRWRVCAASPVSDNREWKAIRLFETISWDCNTH